VIKASKEVIPLPEDIQRRLTLLRAAGALVICSLWGYFAFLKHTEMPVFMFLDIAVHEVGHMIFRPFGELIMLVMGSGWRSRSPSVQAGADAKMSGKGLKWKLALAQLGPPLHAHRLKLPAAAHTGVIA
jgi:hypothetical protein